MTARRFSFRFSLAYALMMLGSGVQLPFLPLWLSAKGIDAVTAGSVAEALAEIAATSPEARVLICGSLYLAGTVLRENG